MKYGCTTIRISSILLGSSGPLLEIICKEALAICVVFYFQEKQYISFDSIPKLSTIFNRMVNIQRRAFQHPSFTGSNASVGERSNADEKH